MPLLGRCRAGFYVLKPLSCTDFNHQVTSKHAQYLSIRCVMSCLQQGNNGSNLPSQFERQLLVHPQKQYGRTTLPASRVLVSHALSLYGHCLAEARNVLQHEVHPPGGLSGYNTTAIAWQMPRNVVQHDNISCQAQQCIFILLPSIVRHKAVTSPGKPSFRGSVCAVSGKQTMAYNDLCQWSTNQHKFRPSNHPLYSGLHSWLLT